MNIINYVEDKKELLKEKLATAVIMGKDNTTATPTETQKDSINTLMKNDTWLTGTATPFFKKYCLADLPGLLKEYTITSTDVSSETKELVTKINSAADKILNKDDQ